MPAENTMTVPNRDPNIQIPFGVGCIHFSTRTLPNEMPSQTRDFIKAALARLPSISNIDFTGEDFLLGHGVLDDGATVPKIDVGPGFYPAFADAKLEFEIYIPHRVQKEVYRLRVPNTKSERFKITIIYSGEFPVAFVRPISPSEGCRASDAVIIVREFLKAELKKLSDCPIEIQTLGPTPFHANFFYRFWFDDATQDFELEVKKQVGYDIIIANFVCPKSMQIDVEQAADLAMSRDIGFYYRVVQSDVQMLKEWAEIDKTIDELRQYSGKSQWERFWNQREFGRTIDRAYFGIVDFEVSALEIQRMIETWRQEKESLGARNKLFPYIESEAKRIDRVPLKQMTNLVQLFESRRVQLSAAVNALLSAIVGGVIGSIATLALG